MKSQKGFSLIEGVITVVLFSVLSLIIAPKFLDLITPAKLKAAQGAVAAVKSGIELNTNKNALDSTNNQFTYPALSVLASTHKWTVNGDKSGICGGNGYAVKTFKEDGTKTTADTDLVASVNNTPVVDATCP